MSANYLTESDKLLEAGRILSGRSRMLATHAHLEAVAQLVREAETIIRGGDSVDLRDWLREAGKVTGAGADHCVYYDVDRCRMVSSRSHQRDERMVCRRCGHQRTTDDK